MGFIDELKQFAAKGNAVDMAVGIIIGGVIKVVPLTGITLPFVSYGGSSLWAFSLMVFVFLRWDAYRWESL